MRIVHVIHGYPPRYNAGSEVYTQSLCRALARRHEVHVFTREEDPFAPDFAVRAEADPRDPRVALHVVNVARSRDRYRHAGVDQRFAELLDRVHPDVVHVGHLNHLSTSLVREAAAREIPIVFTLHDFWLMCPRGQFMQMHVEESELWAACDGQDDEKCARRCYARYFSGAETELSEDVDHWKRWVARRMQHVREMVELVDVFVAPSEYLLGRFRDEYGLPATKLVHMDYGFDRARLAGRRRPPGEPFTFGYIGTHIPAKGVQLLLEAFGRIHTDARLRIWGRPRGQETDALRALAGRLTHGAGVRVEWLPEYENEHIVRDVLERVDAIVVPSIWVENSPLVIHEALQARMPVITANVGGMAELVRHEVNGLLFEFRDAAALARQMGRMASEPGMAVQLGARGYLASTGDVIDIGEHAAAIERVYTSAISRRDSARISSLPGPWRVTFDTNPDTCNLKCVMCEEHSEHSLLQVRRKEAGKPRRVMPIELVRKVIADAAPHGLREVIPSTMGEPLLYDDFEELVALVREYGVKLNLTTNGTFPRLGARAWAELIVPVTSDVKISWNGATAETHEKIMVGTRWETVLENVRTFVAVRDAHAAAGGNRCRVTFQLTFLETNVAELAGIVRLAASLGVDRVKGHHLWAHFAEIEQLSMRRSPEAVRRWNLGVLDARRAVDEHVLPNGRAVLLENIFLLDDDATADIAPGGACPFLGQEAWVSAEGRFDPCCAPDAQRRTLGELGNLHEVALMNVWRGDAYGLLVRSYRTRSLCVGCNMRRPAGVPS
jgi:glycosyltransferase involved in cell wall biosynthesis/MoaA/NifB/PqqE/SkfB family radical SAM enzyme